MLNNGRVQSIVTVAAAAGMLAALACRPTHSEEHAVLSPAKNLRVLPASIARPELEALMRRYARELGVQCSYCHVEDAATGRLNFAADDAPAKQTARVMIAMVADINTRYIAQLGDARYQDPVSCGTCHRGSSTPTPVAAR